MIAFVQIGSSVSSTTNRHLDEKESLQEEMNSSENKILFTQNTCDTSHREARLYIQDLISPTEGARKQIMTLTQECKKAMCRLTLWRGETGYLEESPLQTNARTRQLFFTQQSKELVLKVFPHIYLFFLSNKNFKPHSH